MLVPSGTAFPDNVFLVLQERLCVCVCSYKYKETFAIVIYTYDNNSSKSI